jgi:hypothetical protein
MTLPLPTLDHVVVNVRDRMDAAEILYRRLGFTLTPRGHHTLGSINHLAIFGTDYMELIGAPPNGKRLDILGWPSGLNGLVWGTEDSAGVAAALGEAGVECSPPNEFSRPVDMPGGPRDAVFRTVRLPNETTPSGRLYFCHHFTRDLVWRDEWRHHANGALGVMESVIVSDDPSRLGELFTAMFGPDAVMPIAGGIRLSVGLSNFDVVDPTECAARYGTATAQDERPEYMAALVLRTTSLDRAASALRAGDIEFSQDEGRILVSAADTMGVAIEFRE